MVSIEKDLPDLPLEKWLTTRQLAAKLFRTKPIHIAAYRRRALPRSYWKRVGRNILHRPESVDFIEDFNSRR